MENFDKVIISNINKMLHDQNKKQTELARFLGLPRQTISKILTGNRYLLASEISKIANFFNCEIANLFNEQNLNNAQPAHPFFMGESSNGRIDKTFNEVDKICRIIVEQQFINENKEG